MYPTLLSDISIYHQPIPHTLLQGIIPSIVSEFSDGFDCSSFLLYLLRDCLQSVSKLFLFYY